MIFSRPTNLSRYQHSGFTLVEMLVAVTIVLLMMSMFAQLFQLAGGSVSQQRGIMENDQRARSVQTILKADLDKRTFRNVIPFTANEQVAAQATEADLVHRRGYLYYSENDPLNDADDMLQFTMLSSLTTHNSDETPYVGLSLPLSPSGSNATQTANYVFNNQNQPETDEGTFDINSTSSSPAAEVSYFLRNGNLYRRIVLLRQDSQGITSPQPLDADGNDLFETIAAARGPVWYPGGVQGAGSFYHDFDFSVVPEETITPPPTPMTTSSRLRFNGTTFLDNGENAQFRAMGRPHFRFGHHHLTGRSTEFLSYAGVVGTKYVGRFTLEEQSNAGFTYPTSSAGSMQPMNPNFGSSNSLADTNNNTIWDVVENGSRRGEDLLLPNVHSFDVKLWDEGANFGLGGFVDIEGAGAVDFAATETLNDTYGSQTTANAVFDTWHYQVPWDANGNGTVASDELGLPPFRPLRSDVGVDYDVTYMPPYLPPYRRWVGGQDWSSPPVGLKLFPSNNRPAGDPFYYVCIGVQDENTNGIPGFQNDWGEDNNFNRTLDPGEDTNTTFPAIPVLDYDIYEPGRNGRASWPRKAGLRVRDGELIWQAVDNRKPLRALQITLRFQDPTTAQIRTQTIVHSLID